MSSDIGHRLGSDPALLWLWYRPVAAAPVRPLAWELPYATDAPPRPRKERGETHGLGEQTCGCQEGGEGSGMDWESGVIGANYCIWSG